MLAAYLLLLLAVIVIIIAASEKVLTFGKVSYQSSKGGTKRGKETPAIYQSRVVNIYIHIFHV